MVVKRVRKRERMGRLDEAQNAKLKQRLNEAEEVASSCSIIPRDNPFSPAPLTPSQQRLWLAYQISPNDAAYNLAGSLRFKGHLNVQYVKACFEKLIVEHPILNVNFNVDEHDQVWQKVNASPNFDFHLLQHGQLSVELLRHYAQQPFNLEIEPLLRVFLQTDDSQCELLVIMHHIISDGTSMQMLLDEFVTHYEHCQEGRQTLNKLRCADFLDFAMWQNEQDSSQKIDSQLSAWKNRLTPDFEPLSLPCNERGRAQGMYRIGCKKATIDSQCWASIKRISSVLNTTSYVVLLTSFQLLLSRYSGKRNIKVGVPVANRHQAETLGIVGFFVNTQLIEAQVDELDSFAGLIAQIKQFTQFAQTNQDLPFEKLLAELKPPRHDGFHPLFQVMFNYLKRDKRKLKNLVGAELINTEAHRFSMPFDLQLDVVEDLHGDTHLLLYFATSLYTTEFAEQFMCAYTTLISEVEDHLHEAMCLPEWRHSDPKNRLSTWQSSSDSDTEISSILKRINEQTIKFAQKSALKFGELSMSYAQLNEQSNKLARYLNKQGVGSEHRVGVLMNRSLEMVLSLLSILKSGAAYVPLDPNLPEDRLNYIVEASDVSLVLSQTEHGFLKSTIIDINKSCWRDCESLNLEHSYHPLQAAYVIFTSGSTGKPKGVVNHHQALHNRIKWQQSKYPISSKDTILQKTPFGFDVSVWEFFWPLMHGATLSIAAPEAHKSPDKLVQEIVSNHVTVIHFVPSMLLAFLEEPLSEQCISLKHVICSGEALPTSAVDKVKQRLPHVALHNLYGPTEAAIDVSYFDCNDPCLDTVPIGRPITGIQLYVLDKYLNPASIGTAGELYIGGIGLARGYIGRPDLSAERFIANPFSSKGEKLYKTGDVVRWQLNGELEYLGRTDHQIKIRGLRIELGEIENQLTEIEGINEAAVVAQKVASSSQLIAYVSGRNLSQSKIHNLLAEVLPEYMVPTRIIILDKLPLSHNGKIDRKSLPQVDNIEVEFEPPKGQVEATITRVWSDIFNTDTVCRKANFFELGGDSINALRVVSALKKHGIVIEVQDIFVNKTVQQLAHAISSTHKRTVNIPRLDEVYLGLSYAQSRQHFLWKLDPDSSAYHIAGALSFKGTFNRDAFEAAIDAVYRQHAMLRVQFKTMQDGEVRQICNNDSSCDISFINLIAEVGEASSSEAFKSALVRTPFDLQTDPLMRVGLIAHSACHHEMVVVMHHIISDGWSMRIIVEDFVAEYARIAHETPFEPRKQPIRYSDFAHWQKQWLEAGEQDKQLQYWQKNLGHEHPILTLTESKNVNEFTNGEVTKEISKQDKALLDKYAQSYGCTLLNVLMSAWQVLLYRYSAQHDIRVGMPIANRHISGTQNLVGMFVNTLVIRGQIYGAQTLNNVLHEVVGTMSNAQANQDVPFERVVDYLNVPRNVDYPPLFQVMMNHQRLEKDYFLDMTELEVRESEVPILDSQFPLTLNSVENAEGRLNLTLIYAERQFSQTYAEKLLADFSILIKQILADDQQFVGEIALQSDKQKSALLSLGQGALRNTSQQGLHKHITKQAKKTPTAVALRFGEQFMTYEEFDKRTNQLANFLSSQGVNTESKVALGFSRCLDMYVSIVATLKAGGVYVPIEPTLPRDRVESILEQSTAKLILSNQHCFVSYGTPCFDASKLDLSSFSSEDLGVKVAGEQLAYVIFTSGSTGKPKGVGVSHSAIYNRIAWQQEQYPLKASDVVLQKTPYGFDVSVWEYLLPLMSGATLAIAQPEAHKDSTALLNEIVRYKVSVIHFVPSMLQIFNGHPDMARATSLQSVFCSGEALPSEVQATTMSLLPNITLHNLYGPTEAAIEVSYYDCHGDANSNIPIGRAVDGCELLILSEDLNLVDVGVPGELYLGGICLARGYVGSPDLTADRFVAHPFRYDGARLYRTGDLVMWNENGEVEYLGRADHQVKLNGLRIELGEIEAQIYKYLGVKEVVVVAEQGPVSDRLVAYVSGECLDGEEIKLTLTKSLPDYMVPSIIMVLESLPLNINGKIDRKALPKVELCAPAEYIAPQTENEKLIASLWQTLLHQPRISRNDDFFQLGGDSIAAAQFIAKLNHTLSRQLPLKLLFEFSVLNAFCAQLSSVQDTIHVPLTKLSHDVENLAAPGQKSLWVADSLLKASQRHSYNIVGGVEVIGELNFDLLKAAFLLLQQKHQSLRMSFFEHQDEVYVKLSNEANIDVARIDLCHQSEATQEADLVGIQKQFADKGFSLHQGPLIRALVINCAAERHRILVSMHHIISDGWSVGVLLQDLGELYAGLCLSTKSNIECSQIDYLDYAHWQHLRLNSFERQKQQRFWSNTLQDSPSLSVLPAHKLVENSSTLGSQVTYTFSKRQAEALRVFAKVQGVALNNVLLSSYLLFMYQITRQSDLVIGVDLSGREDQELSGVIGYFVKVLPLRVAIDVKDNFAALVQMVQSRMANVMDNQLLALDDLIKELNPLRHAHMPPLVQQLFVMQNTPKGKWPMDELALSPLPAFAELHSKFANGLFITEDEQLSLNWVFRKSMYEQSNMSVWLGQWIELLVNLIESPHLSLENFSSLSTISKVRKNRFKGIRKR